MRHPVVTRRADIRSGRPSRTAHSNPGRLHHVAGTTVLGSSGSDSILLQTGSPTATGSPAGVISATLSVVGAHLPPRWWGCEASLAAVSSPLSCRNHPPASCHGRAAATVQRSEGCPVLILLCLVTVVHFPNFSFWVIFLSTALNGNGLDLSLVADHTLLLPHGQAVAGLQGLRVPASLPGCADGFQCIPGVASPQSCISSDALRLAIHTQQSAGAPGGARWGHRLVGSRSTPLGMPLDLGTADGL